MLQTHDFMLQMRVGLLNQGVVLLNDHADGHEPFHAMLSRCRG